MLSVKRPRHRRRSSGLGAEIRGDTGASALSTLEPTPTFATPPLIPRSFQSKATRPFSKRRKARSLLRRWKGFSFRHTWVNPLLIILFTLTLYLINPTPTNPLHSAIFLSYPLPANHPYIPTDAIHTSPTPTYYGKGPRDFAFVAFYIIVLSFTREFLMQRLIRPLALYNGITARAKQNRFMEQAYTAMYFFVFGPFGLFVMSRTPVWYFSTRGMFEDFPHQSHEAWFKAYYLLQASYWAQQAIVLCLLLEKPRKDFRELVGHHIITLALIGLSYRFHFTYIGLAVYITHDISDFFLATSKTLNYINSPFTVPYFTTFIFIWVYLRHYINLRILWAVLTTFSTIGPYELNWETQQYKCRLSQVVTFGLLACLQAINLFWLWFILRIAYRVYAEKVEKDVRSDDEEDEEDEVDDGEDDEDEEEEEGDEGKGAKRSETNQPEMLRRRQLAGKENGNAIAGRGLGIALNGRPVNGHDSYADVVVERRKGK